MTTKWRKLGGVKWRALIIVALAALGVLFGIALFVQIPADGFYDNPGPATQSFGFLCLRAGRASIQYETGKTLDMGSYGKTGNRWSWSLPDGAVVRMHPSWFWIRVSSTKADGSLSTEICWRKWNTARCLAIAAKNSVPK